MGTIETVRSLTWHSTFTLTFMGVAVTVGTLPFWVLLPLGTGVLITIGAYLYLVVVSRYSNLSGLGHGCEAERRTTVGSVLGDNRGM
jgi:hypothetical protein